MSTYKVLSAEEEGRLPPRDGMPEVSIHTYQLEGVGKPVKRYPKVGTPLEQVGSTVEWDLTPTKFGFKARPPQRDGGGFGGGGGFKPRDPKETRAIQRQHSQEMALRFVAIKAQLGKLDDFLFSDIQKITTAFEDDLRGATPKSEVPADTEGLSTVDEALADGKDVPF